MIGATAAKGNAFSDRERQTISDFGIVFDTPEGKRVLDWMEQAFQVRVTVEPEEALNKELELAGEKSRVQIDIVAMSKRQGMKTAYWKVRAMIDEALALKNREVRKNE